METLLDSENPTTNLDHTNESSLSTMDRQRLTSISLPTPGKGTGGLFAIAGIYIFAVLLYAAGYGFYVGATGGSSDVIEIEGEQLMKHLMSLNGLTGVFVVQFFCVMPILIFVSKFKEQTAFETLAIKSVSLRVLAIWIGALVLYIIGVYALDFFIETPTSEFSLLMSGSKHLPLAISIVVLVPILEETIFRGYLFKAWRHSWLGSYGTILVTSVLFTLVHAAQYDMIILLQIFPLALILGFARERTGSLLVPIAIHSANNLLSAVMGIYMGIN